MGVSGVIGVVVVAGLAAWGLVPSGAGGRLPDVTEAVGAARVSGPELIALPAPAHFRRQVTNPYHPLRPGTRWVYRGSGAEAGERVVVRVLRRTKRVEGIRATVVKDTVRRHGKVVELTFDWYAQDDRGRVWYLGENTTAFEDGGTSKEGSWQAGVDGAHAGIAMFRRPSLNQPYWQEYRAGVAEDQGVVLTRTARAAVPVGRFRRVVLTKDTTPLEPRVMELKLYARGVGLVLEVGTSPHRGQLALVRFRPPAPDHSRTWHSG